ncbi:aminotransferase class I/II-fold pyridoxal phosphate-dependent enzyme [Roseburia hominis]|uniref:aminotransferase class I/II-fold pyridoxal phosphate-dependent enzyme n=1 Tax=Roseburia hominis TaxID=301301 RepID=UPI0022E12FDB|nr:aminotransferase class V-fold PLP-dependent enzyme [Roseburia hominis]
MYQQLISYGESDVYPFHMPGHKRRALPFPNPYTIDITEIDGFDNLHHAGGLIREAEERAAKLYGADRSYYLVNGSTCGLLAAICAAARRGDKVLAARNCHKAVYHAVSMQGLSVEFLYPAITRGDLQGQITAAQVEEALTKHPDIAVVILTSPTYEGIVSDVAAIAACCHAHGAALIVDEAHGAHFGFGAGFPENAVRLGADAVIMSLHKTLPSFTQTALLHCNGGRIDTERVARYLGVYETSSPSYLFMAGMDACIDLIREQGAELFAQYRRRLDAFYRDTADLAQLHVMRREDLCKEEAYDWDDSKLMIYAGTMGGEALHQELLGHYHLQMEMVSADYVLGMTSLMDTDEGMRRLVTALHEIDEKNRKTDLGGEVPEAGFTARMYRENPRRMQIYQALDLPYREVPFDEAVGKMAADYVYLYPPGIPLIVPGEVITEEFIRHIRECRERKLNVEGQGNLALGRIKIVYF